MKCALTKHIVTRAFTLIEVVLAIFLAIGILLGLLFFYQQAANLRAELITQAEHLGAIRLIMERITTELRTARTHAFYEGAFLGDEKFLQFIKADDIPRSAWRSGERVTRALTDLRLVRYSAGSDPSGTNTAIVSLHRSEEPLVEQRTPRGQIEGVAGGNEGVKRDEPLSEAIRFVKFRYFDGKTWGDAWDGIGVPAAVEVNLAFEAPAEENGAAILPDTVFRRVVYLPGSIARHPEFKVFEKLSDSTNEVSL